MPLQLRRVWWNPVFLTAQARKSLDEEKSFLRKEVPCLVIDAPVKMIKKAQKNPGSD